MPTSLPEVFALFDELDAKDWSSLDRLFWQEGGSKNRSAFAGLSTNFLSSMFSLSTSSAEDQIGLWAFNQQWLKNGNYRNNNKNKLLVTIEGPTIWSNNQCLQLFASASDSNGIHFLRWPLSVRFSSVFPSQLFCFHYASTLIDTKIYET